MTEPTYTPNPAAFQAAVINLTAAVARHDKRATYAAAARLSRVVNPDEQTDIARTRFIARCFAGEMFGWEIEP